MVPSAEAMSGNHWCPTATVSSGTAGVEKVTPSAELRTKTFDCPLASSPAYTTCTPLASAATAEELKNREYVKPEGQAKGPSPQSTAPIHPLNWSESKRVIDATGLGGPNETPPFVDFSSQISDVRREDDEYVRYVR